MKPEAALVFAEELIRQLAAGEHQRSVDAPDETDRIIHDHTARTMEQCADIIRDAKRMPDK